MGACTGQRKRNFEHLVASPRNQPDVDCHLLNSNSHTSKKPRFSPVSPKVSMSLQGPKTPEPSASRSSRVPIFYKYPSAVQPLKREIHAPVRNNRFENRTKSGYSSSSRGGLTENHSPEDDTMGNFLVKKVYLAKLEALLTLRNKKRFKEAGVETGSDGRIEEESWKGKEVIDVDEEDEKKVEEDSSIEEVERVENDDFSWKRSYDNGILESFEPKVVERDFSPSRSLAASDVGLKGYRELYEDSSKRDGKIVNLKFQIELNEAKVRAFQSVRPLKKAVVVEEDTVKEAFVPLSSEEKAEVSRALGSNSRKVLVSHENSNIEITGAILQCLRPGAWLNDEVINLYLELLKEREKREPKKFLNCHFFNTFFYKKLISGRSGYNYQAVRRWTTQKKLGYCLIDCDKIFVPIHQEIHWCLAVINKKEEKFQYLDSLRGRDGQVMKVLARYFVDEVRDKTGKDIDVGTWKQEYVEDLPEQENGFDCGVFMIKYADFYSRDIGLCFNQKHMPYFRERTVKEILRLRAD